MFLHKRLPEYHLSADAKDVARIASELIVLIAALVLGSLISSAKSTFDAQNTQIQQITAKIILLDVLLEKYGPEARTARDLLRRSTGVLADRIWRVKGFEHPQDAPFRISADPTDEFYDTLWKLSPINEIQRAHKDRAIKIIDEVTETRLVLRGLRENAIQRPSCCC